MTQAFPSQTQSAIAATRAAEIPRPNHGKVAVAFSPVCNALTGLVVTGVLARLLSAEYFGLYTSWIYAASILSIVFSLGFPAANAYLAAKYPKFLEVIFGHSVATSLTLGLVGALTLLWYIQSASVEVPFFLLVLTPLLVPMTVAQSAINGALLGAGRHHLYAFISGFQGVVNLAFCTILLLLPISAHQAFSLAITNYVVATALALAVNLTSTGRIGRPNLAFLRECLPQSMPLWIHSIFAVLLQRSDVMVLSCVLSPAEVGTFALASKLSEALSYLPQGISLAVFSDLARSNTKDAVRIAASLIRLCLLVSLIASIPVCVLFTTVLPAFVPSAGVASELLPPMVAASILAGPIYLLCSFSQAMGEPRDVLAMTGVAVIAKLSVLIIFTPLAGLKVVPFALVLASVLGTGFALMTAARRARVAVWKLLTPSRDDLAVMQRLIRFAQESSR